MSQPVILLGAGGHARVLVDALRLQADLRWRGILDPDPALVGATRFGLPVLGCDDALGDHPPAEVLLVNGLGSVRSTTERQRLFERCRLAGYGFLSVIHPSAVIARDVRLGEGVQLMAGAIVQAGASVGDDSILNTRASMDHDTHIGAHVHVAPGATLCGHVVVEDGVHVGAGATVLQHLRIGGGALVAAGAVVIRDVPPLATVMGVPARVVPR